MQNAIYIYICEPSLPNLTPSLYEVLFTLLIASALLRMLGCIITILLSTIVPSYSY